MKIEFENNTIEFNVQYGNRKKISIHIDSLGLITVKAPNNTSDEIIISAVEHHGKGYWRNYNHCEGSRNP